MKRRELRLLWYFFLASLVLVSLTSVASAQADFGIVDQEFVSDTPNLWWSIQYLGPVGQEFTPRLPGMDAASLWLADGGDGVASQVQVLVHEGSVKGPIVGTSSVVALPDRFTSEIRFDFPSLVYLTPGSLYVLEPIVVSGGNSGVWLATGLVPGTGYPYGRPIAYGEPLEESSLETDMLFREGFAMVAPRAKEYCKDGLWQMFRRVNASPFKNQGDCIQYVNTGK